MSQSALPHPRRPWATALAILSLAGLPACGANHHLRDYQFSNHSMALVYIEPPAPALLTGGYGITSASSAVDAVIRAGTGAVKEVEARRASVRLDSATTRVDVAARLADETLARASRYLGVRPVPEGSDADFLLEVRMRSFGIDARGHDAAYLYTNAEAVLLDRRTGREIWSVEVEGNDRLTPQVDGTERGPAAIITAGTLSRMSVADFQHALAQLVSFSSTLITDELRSSLREARKE
jgi:hypothetical protein